MPYGTAFQYHLVKQILYCVKCLFQGYLCLMSISISSDLMTFYFTPIPHCVLGSWSATLHHVNITKHAANISCQPVKILSYVLNDQLLLINIRVQFLSFLFSLSMIQPTRSLRNAVMSSVYKHYVKHTEHRVNLSCPLCHLRIIWNIEKYLNS